jgi:hypothetical protein
MVVSTSSFRGFQKGTPKKELQELRLKVRGFLVTRGEQRGQLQRNAPTLELSWGIVEDFECRVVSESCVALKRQKKLAA